LVVRRRFHDQTWIRLPSAILKDGLPYHQRGVLMERGSPGRQRRRVARLTAVAVALAVLALGSAVCALWLAATTNPTDQKVGGLPLEVDFPIPLPVLASALLWVSAWSVGLAALGAAARMRVLARDTRVPAQLPVGAKRARRAILSVTGPPTPTPADSRPAPVVPPSPPAVDAKLRLTVLIPAHNEETTIGPALDSLAQQTRPADQIIVIADNCTDGTAELARAHGTEVFTTTGNTQKKAGALNQVLGLVLRTTDVRDVVMIMDADTILETQFLATAMDRLEGNPDLMAVGGKFHGAEGFGLLGQLQRNEFIRYSRKIARRGGKVFVLTGTASLFRAHALRTVARARGELIPGDPDQVYDTLALTEDNEITLALKTLGAQMVSPMQCQVTTEVMPTWRRLWHQRMRWERGAVENVGAYGLTPATARYWLQQLGIAYGTVALYSYVALFIVTVLSVNSIQPQLLWTMIALVFVIERTVSAWAAGWRGRLIALPIFIELTYSAVLQAVFIKALIDIATGRKNGWEAPAAEAQP
jgi:cellulose synthase/poly-beta-1,6-N-acetylglucosamine synthase-like glycosyltransferase